MKIAVGCDPNGLGLKDAMKGMLKEMGHEVKDFGSFADDPKSHTQVASLVAKEIQAGNAERGILICGTGMGVAITANKYKGIYAAVVESEYTARTCRIINNANVLCLGGIVLGTPVALDMITAFLNTEFTSSFGASMKDMLEAEYKNLQLIEAENMK